LAGHNELTFLDKDLHGFPKICVADLSHNKIEKIGTAIAAKSSCVVKDVVATLRIFLQGKSMENMWLQLEEGRHLKKGIFDLPH